MRRFGVVWMVVSVVLLGLAGVASAEALSPWFGVSAVSVPGRLQPGTGADAVQEVVVSATKGSWFFGELGVVQEHLAERLLGYDASAQEVQRQVEAALPGRLVSVEAVKAEPGLHAWRVAFPDQEAPVLAAEAFPFPFEVECKVLEEFGYGSCNGDPGRVFGPLEGGEKSEPEVTRVSAGAGTNDQIVVNVIDLGDTGANLNPGEGGVPLRVGDALPAGVRPVSIEGSFESGHQTIVHAQCDVASVTCVFSDGLLPQELEEVTVRIGVAVEAGSSGESRVSVSGGGGPPASAGQRVTVGAVGEATPFGVEASAMSNEEPGGLVDTQAGSHPFQTTFSVSLNRRRNSFGIGVPAQLAKDLTFALPPGFVGDPSAYPQCTLAEFLATSNGSTNECPARSVIGFAFVHFMGLTNDESEDEKGAVPVFNLEPSVGEPARFGFQPGNVPVYIGTSVRTGSDYGVTAHIENIPQTIGFLGSSVTLWGVPSDPRHAALRGYGCVEQLEVEDGRQSGQFSPCERESSAVPPPLLSLPSACTGPLSTTVEGDSWQEAGERRVHGLSDAQRQLADDLGPGLDGCSSLPFAGDIQVTPDVPAGSTPSGLRVDVHVPQTEAVNGRGLAPGVIRNLTVALPEGIALNAAAADGLEACSGEQVGFTGYRELNPTGEPGVRTAQFTDEEASCPNASKIATVTIRTPLLPNPLRGFAYLAAPQNFPGALQNPFGSLVAMYVIARDPVSGVLVKLAGKVVLSASGQITSTFENDPEVPFEDAELDFFGGERAPLATPAMCRLAGGEGYVTHATFVPWSSSAEAPEAIQASGEFDITGGPNGTPCPGAGGLPFAPTLQSGVTNVNAGSFSELTTTLSREDGQQALSGVQLHFPPGVSGLLNGVKLCGEPQANEGTCPAESLIGETIVSVGLGGDPFTVTGGKVYITGPYEGAPFGLSIVNPAKAGPFVLQQGRPIVVRARIDVDPKTAALTVVTAPTGSPFAIPTIVEGIPLQVKHVYVTVNRPGFTFNPTSCEKMTLTGSIESTHGLDSPQSVPFQVTNCTALAFKPQFDVQTSAKTSRTLGASLHVALTLPYNPGAEANVAKVKVSLPKQLPSPLKTLQKACTEKVFEEDPARCPTASNVGQATVSTPVLEGPLSGPAYFVSHGGAKYPELIIVLTGEDGVTVQVHGETFISKQGITTATFATVPDVPFSKFELALPQREYPALSANGNLCQAQATGKLLMPTEMVGQNGLAIALNTKIAVTGCPKKTKKTKKARHAKRHKKHTGKHKHKHKR